MAKAEIAIRYVHPTQDEDSNERGCRPMLGLRGEKLAHCVGVEYDRIYSVSIPVKYFDKAVPVLKYNDPYPVNRYLEMLAEKSGRATSRVSAKARRILELARDPDNFDEAELESLPDDPEDSPPRGSELERMPDAPSEKPAKGKIRARTRPYPQLAPKAPGITSPAAGSPEKRGRGRPPGTAGTGLIARIAGELKCDPAHLRKACRAAGLKSPYESEKEVRAAWKKHGKA